MKNAKLSALLNTPLGIVIVVGAVVLVVESLLMIFQVSVMAQFGISHAFWDFADPILLTIIVAPLLYFLVFLRMQGDKERYRKINAAALNAIVIVDEQGRITDWNPAAEQMFQYREEEAVGQPLHQLIAPLRYHDDAARGFARFEESGSGPLIGKVTEIAALRKDGSEFPVELSLSAARLQGRWHAIGVIRDLTERKRAEELASAQQAEIMHARRDWKAVFDSVSQPIFLHDNEFRVIRANRAYAEQAGKPFEEIIGQPYYALFPKSGAPLPSCQRAMEKAEEEEEEEEEEVAVDGAIFRSRSFCVRSEQGACLYSVHILEDITERKRAERRQYLEETRLRVSLQLNDMVGADEKAILDFILEEGIRMTGSRYAFIGWINEDASVMTIHSWSREAMEACAIEQPPIEFPIDKAGIWAEPVRNRQAIIINDYAQPHPQKHGYPSGHMAIRRYLGVPVFDSERVAMIAAVANKEQEYDESDVNALSNVMTDAWRVIQRNRAERELRESEERFYHLFSNMSSGVAIYQPDAACETFTFKSVNKAVERIDQMRREDVVGRDVEEVFPGIRAFGLLEVFQRVCRSGSPERLPAAFYQDGRISGWRDNYIYRLDSGEIVAVYDDVTERKQAEQKEREAGTRLKDALEDVIGAIAATLEQRDPYTAGHQRRVAQLAAAIAKEMGLAREVIEGIHFGGLIHDLGKISVPAEILGKPGRLTDIELELIKTHVEAGYQILKDIAFPWAVAAMVRQHHERLDGSGYPQGLKGEQIILEARILAVADVVEAMSANRPYRPGFGIEESLGEITRNRGTQLDAMAVDACLRVIREKGFVFIK